MTTRTRHDAVGPVDCKCKKCGAGVAIVFDRAKERKLYWVVPVGTTHAATLMCVGCKRQHVVHGPAGRALMEQAAANALAAARVQPLENAEAAPTGTPSELSPPPQHRLALPVASDDERIAALEAEIAELGKAKRIADLEAEVARLRAEVDG